MDDRAYKLADPYALALAAVVRRAASSPEELKGALQALGEVVAQAVVGQLFLQPETFRTPMGVEMRSNLPRFPLTVAITTKEDREHFASGLPRALGNCELGTMDFEGRRGPDALTGPVRTLVIPELHGQRVDSLVVAKAALATGCTAVSLTRNALTKYTPDRLIIASAFYSVRGLRMLRDEFPNAHIFVVGDPDEINSDGVLVPGIGMLEDRLGGKG
jgi:uracil phosphoribosyltransferase